MMFEGFKLERIDTGETTLRVRHGGSGPPLLLLHGHPQTHVMWHLVAPRLAREFTVYAVDYPGHGWSEIPKADYTPEFFARFTGAFLEALQINDALMAGVSIGASIPLLFGKETIGQLELVTETSLEPVH